MAERDYSHRTLADKLGLEPGMRVRVSGDVGQKLLTEAAERVEGSLRRRSELDVAIVGVSSVAEAADQLEQLRAGLPDHGAIWVITRKKGHPAYVKQEDLMPIGKSLGLVDNKVCAVDDEHSAIRFVVPKHLRRSG